MSPDIRRYIDSDYSTLAKWLSDRGMDVWPASDMPQIGYVSSEGGVPVAMGFLRRIESKTGMIDALCTNPDAAAKLRDSAIDAVVHKIISMAKELGLIGLVSFSEDKNTLIRSEKFGFKRAAEKIIIGLRLGD